MDVQAGDTFGDFTVVRRLGNGGFGTVYACRWVWDDQEYAVKVIEGSFESARREFAALQKVAHPNVVKCIAAGTLPGGWYLQCALVDGQALSDRLESGRRLSSDEAVHIASEVLGALVAIHPDIDRIRALEAKGDSEDGLTSIEYDDLMRLREEGLVHRDIKPSNIVVTLQGTAVLVDFGLASPSGGSMRTSSGTPAYWPPDFAFIPGDRWHPDVDLYAVGATIYQLLCGKLPYEGADFGDDPVPPQSDVPGWFASWLLRACAPRRSDRFSSAQEMLNSLQTAFSEAKTGDSVSRSVTRLLDDDVLAPYVECTVESTPTIDDAGVVELAKTIIGVEQPIVCGLLYQRMADAMDEDAETLRSRFNRLIYQAVRRGEIEQVERLGGGQVNKTVLLPGHPPWRPRQLGTRSVWHYPKIELRAFAHWLLFTDVGYLVDTFGWRSEDSDDLALLSRSRMRDFLTAVGPVCLGLEDGSWEESYLTEALTEVYDDLIDGMELEWQTPEKRWRVLISDYDPD